MKSHHFLNGTMALCAFALVISAISLPTYASCREVEIGSWRGCEPSVITGGVVSTDKYSAVVSASYSSNGADYNTDEWPRMYIQYGLKGEDLDQTSRMIGMPKGTGTYSYLLNSLDEHESYDFRAVLTWVGGTKRGTVASFTVEEKQTGDGGMDEDTDTTSSDNSSSTTSNSSSVPDGWLFHLFDKRANTPSTTRFANLDERNGLKLAIDDGVTEVAMGDEVSVRVRYENNSTKSYTNATVDIFLPPEFTFESSSKGVYDRIDNVLTVTLPEFVPGAFGTATADVVVSGKHGNLDQVASQARLTAGATVLKVADVNEFTTKKSSGNRIGASASGSGFLPGSLTGWIILLVVLAIIVIIGRRYFVKKDY